MKTLYLAAAIALAAIGPAYAGKNTQAPHLTVRFSLGQTIEQVYDALPQAIKQAISLDEYRTQGISTLKGQDDYEQRLANSKKGGRK